MGPVQADPMDFEIGYSIIDPEGRYPVYIAHIGPLNARRAEGDPLLLSFMKSDFNYVGRTPKGWNSELHPLEEITDKCSISSLNAFLAKLDPAGNLLLSKDPLSTLDSQKMLDRLEKIGFMFEVIDAKDPRYGPLWNLINSDTKPQTMREWLLELDPQEQISYELGTEHSFSLIGLGHTPLMKLLSSSKSSEWTFARKRHTLLSEVIPGPERNVTVQSIVNDIKTLVRDTLSRRS